MKTIDFLNQELAIETAKEEKKEEYQKLCKMIENVEKDMNCFVEIDLEKIKNLNLILESEWNQLRWIQLILKGNQEENLDFELTDEQKNLVNYFVETITSFLHQEISRNSYEKETRDLIQVMEDDNRFLEEKSLENLYHLLEDSILSFSEKQEILIEVLRKNKKAFSYHQLQGKKEQIEEEKLVETNLDFETVKNLLAEFEIDFTKLEDSEGILLKYGNLDNIKAILELLKENKVINRIDYTSKTFPYLLAYSNPGLVQKQLAVAKNYDVSFNDLLCHITNFIPNSKEIESENYRSRIHNSWKKRLPSNDDEKEISRKAKGTAQDFEKNMEYLQQIGLDISKIIKNNLSLLSVKNSILKINIESLQLYGLNVLSDKFSLSALCGSFDKTTLIDSIIELGLYDYLQENSSILTSYNNLLFQNIYYQQKNKEEIFNSWGLKGSLRKETVEPIDEKDRIIDLNEIYQTMPDIESYYECVRHSSVLELENDSNSPLLSCLEQNIFTNNKHLYKIEGIFISRLKVLKIFHQILKNPNLNQQQGLLFAMTYNSLLNKEEFEKIKECIKEWEDLIGEEKVGNGTFKKQ